MKNIFDLTGKTAIVTGASSGLGVQFAKALAGRGADIVLVARRLEKLETVKKDIDALGVKCIAVKCDVTKNDEIKAAVDRTIAEFGKIDILVNNAGVGRGIPAETQTDEQWLETINLNLNSVYYFSREVSRHMIAQKYGKIINIGSIHSSVAMAGSPISAYCTSKGGVLMMTKALANEWAQHNITVNAIGPAYFESEMTHDVLANEAFGGALKVYCPMGRSGREGELDGAIIYFASDASSYTTGQILTVDGGWTTI